MASFWDSKTQHDLFIGKLSACVNARWGTFKESELEFLESIQAGYITKDDLADLLGAGKAWEPSAKQLNYLDSLARKAGYQ